MNFLNDKNNNGDIDKHFHVEKLDYNDLWNAPKKKRNNASNNLFVLFNVFFRKTLNRISQNNKRSKVLNKNELEFEL